MDVSNGFDIVDKMSELQMMQSPDEWPNWPVLPVKRSGQIGCMFEGKNNQARPTVFLINMWQLVHSNIDDVERVEYGSLEEVVSDGWVVD